MWLHRVEFMPAIDARSWHAAGRMPMSASVDSLR